MILVAYVSGHGFGHFVRSSAILSRLSARIHLRTNGRAFFLADRARWAHSVTEVDVGPGVIQRGPLETDLKATRTALQQHLDDWPRLVSQEVAFLRESGARLVFGDVPPLAFAAAAEAGVPSVALANFSWSWIYDGYAPVDPWFLEAAARMRQAESQASLLLDLEMGGGLDHFPRRRRILPVARQLLRSKEAILASLPLRKKRTFVLFSLGGFGGETEFALKGEGPHEVVATSARVPGGVTSIEPTEELPHHELVAAAECVIGKPGYGTVAECLRQPTPLLYLPRGDFREYQPLADGIRRHLPSAPLTVEDLRSGRWVEMVEEARASHPPEPGPAPDGAAEAASILLEMLA